MKCPNCKKEIETDWKFCKFCGKKISEHIKESKKEDEPKKHEEHILEKSHKKSLPKSFWVVSTSIIGAVVLIVLILNNSSSSGGIFKSCRDIQVPYEEIVTKQVPLSYEVISANSEGGYIGLLNYVTNGYVTIRNTDTTGGNFGLQCSFKALTRTLESSNSAYLAVGETKQIQCQVDTEQGEDVQMTYNIIPQQISKQVTETRYRTEKVCD